MTIIGWILWIAERLVDGPHREFELGDIDESLHRTLRERGYLAAQREGVSVIGRLLARRASIIVVDLARDLRLALRQFGRAPRVFFGGSAVLAIGLGVGVFSWGVPYGMFGRGLEVEHPDRFVVFGTTVPLRTDGPWATRTRWGFEITDRDLFDGVTGLEAVGFWVEGAVNWVDGEAPAARPSATTGSPVILSALGFEAEQGRLLVSGDTALAAPPVAVISHALWVRRFGGDPTVVGRLVRINGTQTEIVGVLQAGAGFPRPTDVWLPTSERTLEPSSQLSVMGRLSAGATIPSVVERIQARLEALPTPRRDQWEEGVAFGRPFAEGFRTLPNQRKNSLVSRAGALLMIMALANAANLFLVRAQTRTRELAVRRALGAGRARILRQLAAETTLPALLGIAGAVAIAAYGLSFYTASWGEPVYVWWVWKLELPHLVILGTGALLSTVVVTLVVGAHELRRDSAASLRTSRGSTASRFRLGYALVGLEVAVGSALLLVAGLMVRSSWELRTTEWGFETEAVLTGRVVLDGSVYRSADAQADFWRRLQSEAEAEPGVLSANVTSQLPFVRAGGVRSVEIEGQPADDWRDLPRRYGTAASPSFFETFDVPLIAGRTFSTADDADGAPVAIVNTDFLRDHFPGGEALGRRLRVWVDGEPGPWREIVGIAPHLWMDTDENRFPQGFYMPLDQYPVPSASVAIRLDGPADAFRGAIANAVSRLDAGLPVHEVRTMTEVIDNRTKMYWQVGPMFGALGFVALFMSVVGLYTVLSYLASQRRIEFGIRSALGATRGELVGRSTLRGALPVVAGIAVGVVVGLMLVQGLERSLFEVEPDDPWVTFATVVVLVATCAAAAAIPALSISRTDPSIVLRSDA